MYNTLINPNKVGIYQERRSFMEKNIPDRYRYQMNSDISPYEAWNEQRKKLQKRIQNQYDIKDIKKEL